jgi:hypothetical protein
MPTRDHYIEVIYIDRKKEQQSGPTIQMWGSVSLLKGCEWCGANSKKKNILI